jgi:hypothetical protein
VRVGTVCKIISDITQIGDVVVIVTIDIEKDFVTGLNLKAGNCYHYNKECLEVLCK